MDGPEERAGFPSMVGHPNWPGAWKWGVDFSGGSRRVIAVGNGQMECKYGTLWLGPVEITAETAGELEVWAEAMVHASGGYIHLFPADGDDRESLRKSMAYLCEEHMEADA